MWGSIGGSILSALEKTGDALTDRASAHVAQRRREQEEAGQQPQQPQQPPPQQQQQQQQQQEESDKPTSSWRTNLNLPDEKKREELTTSLLTSWKNVESVTKRAVDAARDAAERERSRLLQLNKRNASRIGDPNVPLDVEALKDAEVVYITDRIITTSHPSLQSATDGDITPDRKLAAVAHLLQRRHGGRYMVWNMSELEYDYSVLDDQVLTYQFPGSPSPPLGLLLKLLLSIESWLHADPRNVAVLHCLTGRGRTSTVLAAFLCWTHEAGFHDPNIALEYIAHCRRTSVESLTIPSQRRYVSYFSNMLDGVRPNQPPLLLKRIIMSEAPKFGKRPPTASSDQPNNTPTPKPAEYGCAPYLQIFKAGKLIFTTAASLSYSQSKEDLPFCTPADGPISFPIETILQGDILVRCRHLTRKGQRISMFRAAFHTGYVPPKVLRLTKAQLDGACNDDKFPNDFFIDMIFEACDAAMASKHLLSGDDPDLDVSQKSNEGSSGDGDGDSGDGGDMQNEAANRRAGGTVVSGESKSGQPITASAYDSMLHRDSRFWDVIAERRKKNMRINETDSAAASGADSKTKNDDNSTGLSPFSGPTIGRRRDFASMAGKLGKSSMGASDAAQTQSSNAASSQSTNKATKSPSAMEAFSIGGEFDFMENDDHDDENKQQQTEKKATVAAIPPASPTPPPKPKRDELMEALMALDDDNVGASATSRDEDEEDDTQEIVFESDDVGVETEDQNKDVQKEDAGSEKKSEVEEKKSLDTETKEGTSTTDESTSDKPTESNENIDESADTAVKDALANLGMDDDNADDNGLRDDIDNLDLGGVEDDGDDEGEINFDDYDDDDEDLEDLENFLTKASGK